MVLAIDDPIPERNSKKLTEREVRPSRFGQAVQRDRNFIRAEAHVRRYPDPLSHSPLHRRTEARCPLIATASAIAGKLDRDQTKNTLAVDASEQAAWVEFVRKLGRQRGGY